MNEGKDDGVGESEALSAHPREAKAWTRYGFPQRADERSHRWQHRKRSFIGLCVITPGIRAGNPTARWLSSFSFFFFLVKKKDTFKQKFFRKLNDTAAQRKAKQMPSLCKIMKQDFQIDFIKKLKGREFSRPFSYVCLFKKLFHFDVQYF